MKSRGDGQEVESTEGNVADASKICVSIGRAAEMHNV